jgi:spermidine synthase
MNPQAKLHATTRHTGLSIERQDDRLLLRFDGDGDAIQSLIDSREPQRLLMDNLVYLMGILMFIDEPSDILLLGVGGGSLIHYLRHHLPSARITAVEYDNELIDLAQQHMQLPLPDARLSYVIDDAHEFITHDTQSYDLVIVDVFQGRHSPPWLLQAPTLGSLKRRLTARGALACNLLLSSEKAFTDYYRQLRRSFDSQTLCLETEQYQNLLIYALNFRPRQHDMSHWMQRAQIGEQRYGLPASAILSTAYAINPVGSGII